MASKASLVAVCLLLGIMALIAWAPEWVTNALHNLLALSNLAIFIFAAAVLAWFVYAVILRRILRARRIANARMRRMMREAADRQKL
jgi:hypothetical protein